MTTEDELIGRNVARFRREKSQADVAKAMRDRGWKWAQNTVSAVEQGERPLRLAEAVDLASVLDQFDVGAFARETEFTIFSNCSRDVFEANVELKAAAETYRKAQVDLAIQGEILLATGVPVTNAISSSLSSWLTRSASEIVLSGLFDDDEEPVGASLRNWVASVSDGTENRGGNGDWTNVLFDTNVREVTNALKDLDGEHPEAS